MGLDLTSFDPMLKDHYSPLNVPNVAYQKNPALGLIKKRSKQPGGGRKWVQPFQYAYGGGGSSTFATAIAASNNNSKYEAWEVTRAKHYRLAKVDNETIEATAAGNMDAFEPAFDEFDKTIEAEANWINFRFYRSKGGAIGRMVNSSFATTALTLDDAAGVWAVVASDVLKLSASDGTSGSLKTGSVTVSSVTRQPNSSGQGVITLSGNISAGVATAAQNDYVFLDGDFGLAPAGLADWIPDSAPSSTAFFGVDRTLDDVLGGGRVDNSTAGAPLHEVYTDMAAVIDNFGGDPDLAFAHPYTLRDLSKQIEGKWIVIKGQGYDGRTVDIGYEGYEVNFNGHNVTIMSDRMCPVKRTYMMTWDTLSMFSAGPAPNFLQKRAGSIIKVSEASDGYEARVGEYMNFVLRVPGFCCVGILG